jgi:DDE superfamily endonuclease
MEKKLHLEVQFLRAKHPNAEIEVWSEDEHRLGLQPILRRVWTSIGSQPIALVKQQYQWLWLYGFVHPESGENYWWLLPKVNTQLFNRVLADFAQEFQLNANKRVLLVVDQAGWHISGELELPEGLDLFF